MVNGVKTDVPSYQVSVGDVVAVRSNSRAITYFRDRTQMMQSGNVPAWLNVNLADMSGSMSTAPGREDIEIPLNEQLIVEYYSR
jgi:small subunit ribosomal protein S4